MLDFFAYSSYHGKNKALFSSSKFAMGSCVVRTKCMNQGRRLHPILFFTLSLQYSTTVCIRCKGLNIDTERKCYSSVYIWPPWPAIVFRAKLTGRKYCWELTLGFQESLRKIYSGSARKNVTIMKVNFKQREDDRFTFS